MEYIVLGRYFRIISYSSCFRGQPFFMFRFIKKNKTKSKNTDTNQLEETPESVLQFFDDYFTQYPASREEILQQEKINELPK